MVAAVPKQEKACTKAEGGSGPMKGKLVALDSVILSKPPLSIPEKVLPWRHPPASPPPWDRVWHGSH